MHKIFLFLILQFLCQAAWAQSLSHERCEQLGRGMNLSFMEHFWEGDPQMNFQNYLEGEDQDWIPAELDKMVAMGIRTVRLPICFDVWDTAESALFNANYFSILDEIIDLTSALDLNLIIDYHHGGLIGENPVAEGNRLIKHWEIIASRYSHTNPERVYFDLYNEPHELAAFDYQRIMRLLMLKIRPIVPGHTFLLGGLEFNNLPGLFDLELFSDDNIIYAFHFYDPFIFTHQSAPWVGDPVMTTSLPFPYDTEAMPNMNNAVKETWGEDMWQKYSREAHPLFLYYQLQHAKSWAIATGKPILCSEWGSFNRIDEEDRCRYTETMVNIFHELNLPNIYWDWNQNFSLFNYPSNTLPECMEAAWEPDPFFTNDFSVLTEELNIYPNPASDFVFVNVKDAQQVIDLAIFDYQGRQVLQRNFLNENIVLPIQDWTPGTYVIRVNYKNSSSKDFKFMVN